jgi:hypothetical protein
MARKDNASRPTTTARWCALRLPPTYPAHLGKLKILNAEFCRSAQLGAMPCKPPLRLESRVAVSGFIAHPNMQWRAKKHSSFMRHRTLANSKY